MNAMREGMNWSMDWLKHGWKKEWEKKSVNIFVRIKEKNETYESSLV